MIRNIIKKAAQAAVEHPWIIIIIFFLITTSAAFQLQNIQLDTAIKSLIPSHMPSRSRIEGIESIFGGTEMVMITVEADDVLAKSVLEKVKYISDSLEKIKEIDKVNSPFTLNDIEGKDNQLIIETAIRDIPSTEAEKSELKERLLSNELVIGNVVSKDFKAISIGAVLKEDVPDSVVLDKIDQVIADAENKFPDQSSLMKAGLPIVRALNAKLIQHDMRLLMPVGLLIMLIFLFLAFKQLRGVFLPFLVVVMSIIFSLALLPILGWKFQLITIILPIIMIAVTNDYGIHIIAAYQELALEEEGEKNGARNIQLDKKISKEAVNNLGLPVIAAGITTMIGLLALISHIIIPARQLGVLAAAGIAFSIVASILFIPAVLSLLKVATPLKKSEEDQGILEKILRKTANLVIEFPKRIIIITLIILIVISSGIFFLKIDTNPMSFYEKDSEIVKATELVNNKFGGANTISIVAEGDIMEPDIMQKISEFEEDIATYDTIGEVTAVSKIMRKMNRELHNGDINFDKIPDSRNALAQYFLLFSMSGDLDKLVDFNRQHALITARMPTNSTDEISRTVHYLREESKKESASIFTMVGGFGDLLSEMVDVVIRGQVLSLLISIILVAIVVMILFNSFTAGFYSILPLLTAVISLFGLMGYLSIELNMITAMLSSIMIGVGIDYTIHFLWRYRKERKSLEAKDAVLKTLLTSGRGIVFNALSVIVGFSVLLISGFLPVKFFAFLVTVSVGSCLIGSLLILPALVLIFKPAFLEVK
jgi:hypothetical protein